MTIRLLMYRLKNIIPRECANQEPKSGFSCQVIYFSMFLETSISRLVPESIHSFGISFVVFCLLVLSFVCLFYVICAPVPGERCLNSLNLRYVRRLQLSVKHIRSSPCLRRFSVLFSVERKF